MPHDLPSWPVVYQQAQRWLAAGCFEAIVHDLRMILRLAEGRRPQPSAAIFDSQTLPSTPRAGRTPALTEPSASKAAKCTPRWTRSGTC